ncbi:MAG: carboxymuconolactone decarboxylase family protein [Candidatus Hodarchaeota archaeon]
MSEDPLKIFEKIDPNFLSLVRNTQEFAFHDGAIPKKYKFLMAMILDATLGHDQGVKALAHAATQAGATKQEIMEALRVAQYISGVASVYTSASGLKDLL